MESMYTHVQTDSFGEFRNVPMARPLVKSCGPAGHDDFVYRTLRDKTIPAGPPCIVR